MEHDKLVVRRTYVYFSSVSDEDRLSRADGDIKRKKKSVHPQNRGTTESINMLGKARHKHNLKTRFV